MTYDFSKVVADLESYLPIGYVDHQDFWLVVDRERYRVFRDRIYDFPDFGDFAAAFFSSDYMMFVSKQLKDHKPPKEKILSLPGLRIWILHDAFERLSRSSDAFNSENLRPKDTYPLLSGQILEGQKFIRKNPEYHVALAALQACVIRYSSFLHLSLKTELNGKYDNSAREAVKNQLKFSNFFSVLHDLSPSMAAGLAKSEDCFSSEAFENALTFLDERSVFRSVGRDGQTDCPFAASFKRILSFRFEKQEDGHLIAHEGELGDLIRFLMHDIQERLSAEQLHAVSAHYEF